MKTIRVGIKAALYQGVSGFRVRWKDSAGNRRSLFVKTFADAKHVKARAKEGKRPKAWCWAVRG